MRIGFVPKIDSDACFTLEWRTPTGFHRHSDWEFAIHYEGESGHIVNGVDYPATPTRYVLLGPHHLHKLYCDGNLVRRDIVISVQNMKKFCNEVQPGLYENLCQMKEATCLDLSDLMQKNIQAQLERVDNYQMFNQDLAKMLLHAIVIQLISLCAESHHLNKEDLPPAWFLQFISKLQTPEYFSKKVEDLVTETNYNHAYFLKMFKKQTGQTLISYVTELRMNHASQLLLMSNMTVIQIANTLGYNSPSFFAQKFRQYFKVTPEQYRKNHGL